MTDKSDSIDCFGKIKGNDLREFATSNSDIRRSVLLEIELPGPFVEFHDSTKENGQSIRPKGVLVDDDDKKKEKLAVIERTKQSISSVISGPLNWLPSAYTFVVRVNSKELCELSKIEDLSRIVANSELKN